MEEPLTISKTAPEQKSMDYTLLREEGLKYVQKIAGRIWTDYNSHDPGVTILEVLCYAITDLGYRTGYPVKDLLARNPADPDERDIANFFTAAEILPNGPVTINDYRKLLIDIEVDDPSTADCRYVGVKNAWLERVDKPEVDIFVDVANSVLVYEPVTTGQEPLDIRHLYKVLLEFDRCDAYGDLNDNKIVKDLTILEHADDPDLAGLVIRVDVQFPRWDAAVIDWEDDLSIRDEIIDIEVTFINLADNFSITPSLNDASEVTLSGTKDSVSGPQPIDGLNKIALKINQFIYDGSASLMNLYKSKIGRINQILDKVRATLNANRNLCEDFAEVNALRIEEILVCADIEISVDADVEETQAHIYYEISRFLSPTVLFYSLDEMFTDCYEQYQHTISSIDIEKNLFTIASSLTSPPEKDSIITISGSNNNNGTYTVDAVKANIGNEAFTDVIVKERIPSDILTEGEKLMTWDFGDVKCRPTEKVFEGPRLKHGFIKDEELEKAARKKVIHVSDLIRIIMAVEGVLAVKNIQIANVPQDNEDGAIASKSVRWCLHLAFDQNYVPRLNTDDSRITFYKDQLPFRARQLEVDEIVRQLESEERPQKKYRYPVTDIEVPRGEYKNIEDYFSIQNEFPLVYGIGEEGLLPATENRPNQAQARQLKGFLMVFDQLLANYLSQLAHVKDLFSMNSEKDAFGDFVVGRTYYTQPLFEIVPDVEDLYVDENGHEDALNDLAEDAELFGIRRNKFLDHLMARFSEQFVDYAMLTYRLSGAKGPEDLIEDKLAFLNSYPATSANRGRAINYKAPCNLWHVDNVSGLERRASMLLGIEERKASDLAFHPRFKVTGTAPNLGFRIENLAAQEILENVVVYPTVDEVKLAIEQVVLNGIFREKYRTQTDDGTNYFFLLECEEGVLAQSVKKDFIDPSNPSTTLGQAIDEAAGIISVEFFENTESNRHNLACSIMHYFTYAIVVDMEDNPPSYTINFSFFNKPFSTVAADRILTGSYTGTGDPKAEVNVLGINTTTNTFTVQGDIVEHLELNGKVIISGSGGADGVYTISSFSPNGTDTDVVATPAILSDAPPNGVLLYNQITEAGLRELAEGKVHDVIWNVVANGVRRERYSFHPAATPFTSPYKFRIEDFRGNLLSESEEADFNNSLANEIATAASGKVVVEDSTSNDQEYSVVGAIATGPFIEVEVSPVPPSPIADGFLSFTETFPVTAVDQAARIFKVVGNLTGKLSRGDAVSIAGSESNDATYTIFQVVFDGADSLITVEENIPSGDAAMMGDLDYKKMFEIVGISSNMFVVKGGADEKAVQATIDFLQSKFFDHEGMHLIEHILLRPRANGLFFVDADESTLTESLADNGSLAFRKKHALTSANTSTGAFKVDGDITADLSPGKKIQIDEAILLNGEYSVVSFSYDGSGTTIVVDETVTREVDALAPEGILSYAYIANITGVNAADQKIEIAGNVADTMGGGDIVEVQGSENGANDGRYTLLIATDATGKTEIAIDEVERLVQDKLLGINLDDECECAVEDPYTCIAHVVLPYWPGRFLNSDFRKFVEKTLRTEAPAHVFLNICWVSCAHMDDFELKYKVWLMENARPTVDHAALSKSLEELILSIAQLRNVYPVGRLHDCDEDENLENAIILNQSKLGEI